MSNGVGGTVKVGSRLWGTTVLAVLAVLACLALGAWQFDRARTRDTPTTAGDPMAVAAVLLEAVVPADGRVPAGSQPVAVTAMGRYDGEHQLLVPGRTQGAAPADYVVTPLVMADGRAVLVVRGWQPPPEEGEEPEIPAPPIGTMTVTGWLVPSESLDAGTVDPLTLPAGQVATVTAARVAGLLPYPIVDGYVGLVQQHAEPPPAVTGPVAVTAPTPLAVPQVSESVRWSVQSLFYAFEWWFFALVVVWMWAQALRIERRREAGAGSADGAQPGEVPAAAPPVPPAV